MSDLLVLRQFLTGNGLFAFFDAPWMPINIGLLFLFHPAFGVVAVFSAIILILLAIWNERATHDDMEKANRVSVESANITARNLRNAEVVHALGMVPDLMARWKDKQQRLIMLQAVASEKGGDHAGLGLAISRNLVERMNGHLSCNSTPQGAHFLIRLPTLRHSQAPLSKTRYGSM